MAYNTGERSVPELLRDWGAIMRELRTLGIVRTNNNPVGDIAEAIVAEHFHGTRGSFAQAGWDVKAGKDLIQVKALRQVPGTKRRNLSPIRDADYSCVVIVIFDEDFTVVEGLRLKRDLVEQLFVHRPYVNGRIITVTQRLRDHPEVEHLDLADAARRVGASGHGALAPPSTLSPPATGDK